MSADRTHALALMREMLPVSRETVRRLDILAELLPRWQAAQNLVGRDTIGQLWTRHIADSAQALAAIPEARRWVDLGSGAGFPGLVTASLLAGLEDAHVVLVEANARKCAFLRTVIRAAELPAAVSCARIEAVIDGLDRPVEAVGARALAPLPRLFQLAAPLIGRGAVGVFHKGQDIESELTQAATSWIFDHEIRPSRTDPRGVILIVRSCRRSA